MFSAAKIAAPTSSGYNLTNSLRFRASASANLTRTFTTPTSSTVFTWSGWIKRGSLGTAQYLFGASTTTNFGFNSSNQLVLTLSGTTAATTSGAWTDPSGWYHVVYVQNGSAQTIYVNSVSRATGTTANTVFNTAIAHQTASANSANYFDGYLAEVNFIDGQALTPSSFGSFNATTGVWQPAKYSGTYGTNGFYLPFTNTASTTTLGYDLSGNSNNWTTNNISLTAGSTYDSMTDVPTLTSATASNYAVLNPLSAGATLTQGNLTATQPGGSSYYNAQATMAMSGKTYFEIYVGGVANGGVSAFGIQSLSNTFVPYTGTNYVGYLTNEASLYEGGGNWFTYTNSTSVDTGVAGGTSQWVGVAFDPSTGKVWFAAQGTWLLSGNPSTGANSAYTLSTAYQYVPSVSLRNNRGCYINFGQQPFTYTPPTGFVALNTYNLPTGTILQGNKYMDATLYTGNGSTQSIVNAGAFQPDLVWAKSRSSAYSNALTDSNRGVTHILYSDLTNAEATSSTGQDFTSFNSNGFSVGTPTNANSSNASGNSIVAWQWKANGSAVSNTNGSITSQVSANTTAGFSVVTYTGNSTASTVGHGLNVVPSMIFAKGRTNVSDWRVYHTSLTLPVVANLNNTTAAVSDAGAFGSTAPT
jgi:hypothetical protein